MRLISFVPIAMHFSKKALKPAVLLSLLPSLFFLQTLTAQQWMDNIRKGNRNFYEIQKSFYKYHDSVKATQRSIIDPDEKDKEEDEGEFSKFKRWEWFMEPR